MYHYKHILETKSDRLISVDILRGLTIVFMIIVNNPGSWSHVYAPLLHAEWNGITPTDYIFPTFLFIVGVSIVLSISKKKKENPSKKLLLKKIVWRSIKIYLVGLFLWLWPNFELDNKLLIDWTCFPLSKGIAPACLNNQPMNGIEINSFFITIETGPGNIFASTIVSHTD